MCFPLHKVVYASASRSQGQLAYMANVHIRLVNVNGVKKLRIYGDVFGEKFFRFSDVILEHTKPFELTITIVGKSYFKKALFDPKLTAPLKEGPRDLSLLAIDPDKFREQHANFLEKLEATRGPVIFDKMFPLDNYPPGIYKIFLKRGKSIREPLSSIELK